MTELKVTASPALIRRVMEKYHYEPKDRETLEAVAGRLEQAIGKDSGFWMYPPSLPEGEMQSAGSASEDLYAEVVLTLGSGADALQEEYSRSERYVEAYMTEALSGELLLECYVMFNRWAASRLGLHVARYHFYGGEEGLELTDMPKALTLFPESTVQCNAACCLTPRKSVVFRAQLSRDGDTVCEGICAGCHNKSCPNRMEQNGASAPRWPDLAGQAFWGQALPYGYARILGTGDWSREGKQGHRE